MKIKITIRHSYYWFTMCIIGILIFFRYIIGFDFPVFLFLPIGFVGCMLFNQEELVSFMCSVIALESCLQSGYLLSIGLFFLILKNRHFSFFKSLPIFFMIMIEGFHFANYPYDVSFVDVFRKMEVLFFLGTLLCIERVDYSDGLPILSFSYMTIYSVLVTLLVDMKMTGFTLGKRLGSTYDNAGIFNGLMNPNVGALLCVISVCGLLLLKNEKNRCKIIFLILSLFFSITLFQSKSGMLAFFIALTIYNITNNVGLINKISNILLLIVPVVFVGTVFFRDIIEGFLMRFSASDLSTGRLKIFSFYNDVICTNLDILLFGVGLTEYNNKIALKYSDLELIISGVVTYVKDKLVLIISHNNIQEIILAWGVLGFILVIWLLRNMIVFSHGERCVINYITLIVVLIYSLQGQLISSNICLIGLVLSYVCLEYRYSNK